MLLRDKIKYSSLALLLPWAAAAQPANTYIANGANVYSYGNVAIYGDLENNGNFGSEALKTTTFYGANWKNGATATFPIVSGAGGTFQFVQPRPAPYANNVQQNLEGGYVSGAQPSFPNLQVNNANNISQVNSATRVANNLDFVAGKQVINATDLFMGSAAGNGGTGTITGYDENKYVVTNSTLGHLVKESYTGAYTYPVGMNTSSYTPAKVNNTIANGMHVNVTNYASSPAPRTGATGVDRTWNIYADNATGNSTIDLEHDTTTEQTAFQPNAHFVTRYVSTTPNMAGDQTSFDKWERNNYGPGTIPGTLTTGSPIASASDRSRAYTTFATNASGNSGYFTKASGPLCVNVRAYIEGALYNNGNAVAGDGRPLMRDNLRQSPYTGQNFIPVKDPYEFATTFISASALANKYTKLPPQNAGYPQLQQVTDSATVFGVTGQDAIVDWVFVELRDKSNSATVYSTRAGLLQRDGDIVDVDGKSCLAFPDIPLDSYYVAVRHRNHLGAMTANVQSFDSLQSLVDFTVPTTPIYDKGIYLGYNYAGLGEKANVKGTYSALWAGDLSVNGRIKYTNPNADITVISNDVLNFPTNVNGSANFAAAFAYFQGDWDLDSRSRYSGSGNDVTRLGLQVSFYPLNTTGSTNFNFIFEQLP
ncbi:MAG: hypothetical protein JST36_00730 [Bacteroidetes bacterium]|nr:hypothetical protein [Bacteroidota bacterium]